MPMQQYRCFRNPGPLMETIPAPQAARDEGSRAAFVFSIPAFSWLPYAILLLWAYAVFYVTPDDPLSPSPATGKCPGAC